MTITPLNVAIVKYLSLIDLANLAATSPYGQYLVDQRMQQGFTVHHMVSLKGLKLSALTEKLSTEILKDPFSFHTTLEEAQKFLIAEGLHGEYGVVSMKVTFPRPYQRIRRKDPDHIAVRSVFPIESKDILSYAYREAKDTWLEIIVNQQPITDCDAFAASKESKTEADSNENLLPQSPSNLPRIASSVAGFFRTANPETEAESVPKGTNERGCHFPLFE